MVARAKRRMRARRGESEAKAKAKRKRSERARRIERASTTGLYTYRSKEEICEMDVGADGTETLESSCIGFRGSVVAVARGGKRQVRFSGIDPDRRGRCNRYPLPFLPSCCRSPPPLSAWEFPPPAGPFVFALSQRWRSARRRLESSANMVSSTLCLVL